MWALRRASNPLKNQAFSLGNFRAGCARLEIASYYLEDDAESVEHMRVTFDNFLSLKRHHHRQCDSLGSFIGRRHFSSEAGMKSNGEEDEDLEDGFSELETSASAVATEASNVTHENDDELISEHELSEEDNDDDFPGLQNDLELSDTETDVSKKRFIPKRDSLQLLKAIMASRGSSVRNVLEKWVEVGNDVNKTQILTVIKNLRKRRMYGRALQLLEWLESSKRLDFSEREYASRLDLIAKVLGLRKAESYMKLIPKSYRGARIYQTYLASCGAYLDVRKAEEVFNKMKDLQFTVTAFACDQLLLLYKRLDDKKKIADVLLLMEKENVKPTIFTYNILINTKGQSNDMVGMDQIVETMKAEGIEPSIYTQSLLAKYYVSGGFTEKAEVVMKEMEGGDLKENRAVCLPLLLLYASLGKADDVSRIWKVCQSDPSSGECLNAIEAWGRLNKVEEAEAVFEKLLKRWENPSSKTYSSLLKVYADHKMLAKGKELVKRMSDSGCRIGPLTWDALVKLYVAAGEVEKADSILQKAAQQNQNKPLFNSYIAIMDQYSKRGDVHNAEKMFHRIRQVGYAVRLRLFQCLVQTYINANSTGYGMRERMKADNIFPNKSLAGMLVQVDPFKKTSVSELLD